MKRRDFLNYLALIGTTAVTIKGCGGSQEPAVIKTPAAGSFQVAIALPQEVEDLGWSKSGYEGLKLIEKELSAGVAYRDKVDLPPKQDFEKIFTEYAAEGFDFIIGHGGQFEAALITVAKQFPRQKFALMGTYPGNNRNLGALSVRSGELGYLAGVIAALKTKTEKVATIGGMPIAVTKEGLELFERGAIAINPKIEVFEGWVNSFGDAVKAKEIAEEAIAWGADVIGADAGSGNTGIFEAALGAKIKAIGWTQDQYDLAPEAILTSCVIDVPKLLLQGAILVRQGRWEGKQYKFGIGEGVQYLADFRGALTAAEEEIVSKVRQDILAGKIDVSPRG